MDNLKIKINSSSTNILSINQEGFSPHIYSLVENISFNFQIVMYLINSIRCCTNNIASNQPTRQESYWTHAFFTYSTSVYRVFIECL